MTMLVDNVSLFIKAGNGGNGSASLLHNGLTFKGGPDGGNGGNGGNIYIQGSTNITDLREFRFKKKIRAQDGVAGGRQKLFGKNAEHLIILVPLGTSVTDTKLERVYEVTETKRLLLVAKGGKGGRGNTVFKSATNQTPEYAEYGKQGEEKTLLLELRLIAEIGLIGLPNAGKSSLLSVLTNATPKIANYPFTTLEPNIGMFGIYPIADIPGLIEGAAQGRGLGAKFLKHIEKTKMLIHCIELTENNIEERYQTVRLEFEHFNTALLEKPEIILLTKTDLVDEKTVNKYKSMFEKKGKQVLTCSLYDQKSVETIKKAIENFIISMEEKDEATESINSKNEN
ncbi:MAG TPA: GTPase ObgE [Candidatus Saccharimonadales bacterium]|nr:GTPase ObgE [Candidatus Saccharimonadales bacterium]